MKTTLAALLLSFFFIHQSRATDIVVEEFGLPPAYATINDAVTAAADGDRIIIKNRAGNIPWIENVTITKALEFLPFDNDTFFVVQGNYTVNIASGKTVTFIGMRNTNGNIITTAAPSGNKVSTVNVFGSWLMAGYVELPAAGYGVNVVNTQFDDGYIRAYFGSVIGCDISSSGNRAIWFSSGSAALNDTLAIIGNKVNMNTTAVEAVYITTTTSRVHVRNNFIKHRYTGLELVSLATGYNLIYNNTILAYSTSSSAFGMRISNIQTNAICEVMNNVIDATSSGNNYGIYNSGNNNGTTNIYYNHVESTFTSAISPGWTFSGNNTTSNPVSLQADGQLSVGSPAINNGNPAAPYYDLDLSAGDPGAYGASFTLNNFFPIHAGGARVFMYTYPFNVRQGNTLNIKASSYDR